MDRLLGDLLSQFIQTASDEIIYDCGTVDLKMKIARLRLAGNGRPQGATDVCPQRDDFESENENGVTLYLSEGAYVSGNAPACLRRNVIYVIPKNERIPEERCDQPHGGGIGSQTDEQKEVLQTDVPVCPGICLYTNEPFADVFNRFLDLFENQEEKDLREDVAENELEHFFARILDGQEMAAEELAAELTRLQGPPLHGCFWLSRLSVGSDFGVPFPMVRWNLKNRLSGLTFFSYHDDLYLLKTSRQQQSTFPTKEERVVLDEVFGNEVFTCGVSNEFFNLTDLPSACSQCEEALKLGEKYLHNRERFYRFDEVSLHYIMQELHKSVPFSMISSPYYQILKRYDEENRGNLTYIFLHFIKNNRNINRTAAEIFMHRNTVLNNVKKAYTVMQSECDNFPAQLAFMISYFEDISGRTRQ